MDMNVPQAVLQIPESHVLRLPIVGDEPLPLSPQLRVHFDPEQQAMWSRWSPQPRPCFNPRLLGDIKRYYDFLSQNGAAMPSPDGTCAVEYVVLASGTPGIFNLGGDLDLFKQHIELHDREGLLKYGHACIQVLYRNYIAHDLHATTISLVQGECLGGGFEAALSSDLIIAEKKARFGFPEILFNLFPGMGAYSFLKRKVGQKITEEVITSGKIYSADDMLALGVVDVVAEDGQGEAEVAALIKRRQKSHNGLASLSWVRRRVDQIEYA
ncbi:MAG: crotonase/enoyl-CoA hydratase family protein, partial [Burkholderiales bacterium]